jgi:hypothetical protein
VLRPDVAANNLDAVSPVEWGHPLNRGRVQWLSGLPGFGVGPVAHDLTGNRNHGVLAAGATWGYGPPGVRAVVMNGTDDHVSFTQVGVSNGVTIAAWVYATALSGRQGVCHNGKVFLGTNGTTIEWWPNTDTTVVSAGSIATGRWYRLLATQAGTSYAVYLDGNVTGSGTTVGLNGSAEATTCWGKFNGTTWPWVGSYTDMSIWRRGVSAAEAWAEYDQSRRGYPDLLRRVSSRVWSFGYDTGGGGGGGGLTFKNLLLLGCG